MKLLTTLIFLVLNFVVLAQTIITGKVVDGVTGDPLPYVTIRAVGGAAGAISNFDGYYTINTPLHFDSIEASYLGYTPQRLAVNPGFTQEINFTLYQSAETLGGVTIRPGGINPADLIMKRASKNKKNHDPERIEHYEYESYSKVQLAVDNVSDKFKKRRLFKEMEPLFDTISSFTDTSSNKVLPVFVSETISDYYFRKNPRRTKEYIKATKIQGVGVGEESYIAQILGSTFQQYNFYQNNLYILDKDFISPLSIQASSYYFFQLIDSVIIDNQSCYQISVTPKNYKDLAFHGTVWIATGSFALKQLNLEITREANLNFIEKLKIQQEFTEVEPNYWIANKTRVLIDIAELTNNSLGLIGLYYNSTKNIKINQERDLAFFEEKVWVADDAYAKSSEYWDSARHEQISKADKRIYLMVDSLKNQPLIKSYVAVAEILVKGYIPAGKIELGPYHYILGYNNLEGVRTQLGFRTSSSFHQDLTFRIYGAYGYQDEAFKYGFYADYVLNRKKWSKFGLDIKNDVELIGITDENFGTTALYDAFATFGNSRLNRGIMQRIWYEKELFKGYTQQIKLTHKEYRFQQIGSYNFLYATDPNDPYQSLSSNFETTTINLRGRLSHKEQFVIRRNNRLSFGNLKAPVLSIDYTHGFKDVLQGDFNYDKLGVELWQFNSLGNLGTFEYTIKAYKIFGALPYPALFVMRGNQSPLSSSISYNLMNWFEFAADQYVSAEYEHQFNGLLLNRVPLINQWKWRSFVNMKAAYGSMTSANTSLLAPPETGATNPSLFSKNLPYIEAGYGIENIFKFIRVDFIHRLTYLDDAHPNARSFAVKGTAVFRF